MKATPQEIRYQFINSIMEENDISLKSVCECMENNKTEINNMNTIFNSEDEISVQRRMVLLSLISRNQARENLDFYKEVKNINKELNDSDIDQYKVLMITALMSNTLFYVSACNWCGLIRREINKQQKMSEKAQQQKKRPPVIYRFPEPKYDALAAATTGFTVFHQTPLNYEDINGTLYFKGNDQNEVFLEFEHEQHHETIPFDLEICFTTRHDLNEHKIVIPADSRVKGTNIYNSHIESDVYYSEGIKGEYTVTVIWNK